MLLADALHDAIWMYWREMKSNQQITDADEYDTGHALASPARCFGGRAKSNESIVQPKIIGGSTPVE